LSDDPPLRLDEEKDSKQEQRHSGKAHHSKKKRIQKTLHFTKTIR